MASPISLWPLLVLWPARPAAGISGASVGPCDGQSGEIGDRATDPRRASGSDEQRVRRQLRGRGPVRRNGKIRPSVRVESSGGRAGVSRQLLGQANQREGDLHAALDCPGLFHRDGSPAGVGAMAMGPL